MGLKDRRGSLALILHTFGSNSGRATNTRRRSPGTRSLASRDYIRSASPGPPGVLPNLIQNNGYTCLPPCTVPLHNSSRCPSDRWVRQEFVSLQNYCYGYNVDEPAAVDYLLSNYPEWSKVYHLFKNHWAAMTIVARDLSDACGLTVCADRIWVGGGCIGLGMVFMGISMGNNARTPEDNQKLKKLERKLVELKLVTTPKLEILCSCSYRPHFEEPFHMHMLPPPDRFEAEEVFQLAKRWREEHERRRQCKGKRRQGKKDGVEMR